MQTQSVHLGREDAGGRDRAVALAAGALRGGRLVVMPTETVYGIAACCSGPGASGLEAFRAALGPGTAGAEQRALGVWHAADVDAVRAVLELTTPVARRLVARLLPGPVQFLIEQSPEHLARVRARLGVGAGVIDDGRYVSVRVPDHAVARRVLAEAGGTVVATRASAAVWWRGRSDSVPPETPGTSEAGPGQDLGAGVGVCEGHAPAVVLGDGPTRHGTISTAVRVRLSGAFEVEREGAVATGAVMGALERVVLFVCTGNTCRSPMAEGIARELVARGVPNGITTRVESAGVAAGEGIEPTPQAVEALRKRGIDIAGHRSRRVTAGMIERAEAVWAMTPSHAEALMRVSPGSAGKIEPIDPRGVVPDPIGLPQDVYDETAERLRELIVKRLSEIEA